MKYNISLRTILTCLFAFGLLVTSYSQTATRNYITTYVPKVPLSDEMSVPGQPKENCIKTVQYFDGLGRPDQTIQVALSPLGKDIVQPIGYDEYSREAKKYLPYRGSNSNGNYVTTDLTEQGAYYLGQFTAPDNGFPYAETVFDNSPLNLVMKQGAPGSAWQPAQRPIRYTYSTNTTSDVRLWTVNANNSISTSGFYLPGKLYKTVIKDENWAPASNLDSLLRTSEEYKDLQGNVVLKRSYVKVSTTVTPVETYYVYDDFGLLRYVLPPEAVKNRGTLTPLYPYTPLVKNLCYFYQYDARKRLIIKQLPGAGQVHLVYDNRDRLVASQDSVQRAASKWLVTKYDHLNRPVMTALKSLSDNRGTLQTYLDTYVSPSISFESRTTTGVGYTLTNSFATKFTLTETDLLSVTYYDTYGYPGTKAFDNTVRVSDYYNSTTGKYYCEQTRSLVTGSRVKVLDGTEHNSSGFRWLVSTVYYDDKYRSIQTLRDLYSTVTTDNEILSTQYYFIGKTLKTLARQVFRGNTNSVTETYLYDHADRLTQIKHKLNSGTEITLASMEYNDLGQHKRKALHGQIGAGIQDLNYAYNIRGWLEKINNPEVNPTTTSTQKLNLGLYYNNVPAGLSVSSQYNGNISALTWNTPSKTEALSPAYKQGYGFTYDPINRLTASVYGDSTNFATSVGANNESYTYDLNGNIKSLARYRKGTGLIDNLTYTYKNSNISNLLDKVEDASGTIGFVNGVNTTNEYSFDGNGNLKADLNKGYTSILYNYLNLPKRVGTATAGQYISYIYDAVGSKLAKIGTTGTYTYYAGGFVYNGSSLSYIIHEEGHLEPSGAYKYYLKDHLGSVRLVVNTTGTGGTIEQQTDYYPFGMTIAEYNGSVIDYRYNGKELQDDLINGKKLDWYDYGARFYDPQIGRWHVVDPLATKYYQLSSYCYVANNPLKYIDSDGKRIEFAPGVTQEFKDNFAKAVAYLNQHGASGILKSLQDRKEVIYIGEGNNRDYFSPSKNTIIWDPNMGVITSSGIELSPTTALNHEADHALQQLENPDQKKVDLNTPDLKYGNKEEKRVIEGSEQETARKLGEIKEGETTRTDHEGTPYETKGPTTTEEKNPIIVTPQKNEEKK